MLGTTQVEYEMAVKGFLPQKADNGVFERIHQAVMRSCVWYAGICHNFEVGPQRVHLV